MAITDVSGLRAALAACGDGGQTIHLDAPLTDVSLGGLSFKKPVTIVGEFRSSGATKASSPALYLMSCSGIVVADSVFSARVDDQGWRWGSGFKAEGCSNVHLQRAQMRDVWQGAAILHCNDVSLIDNDILELGSLGMQIGGENHDVTITGNQIAGFHVQLASADHPEPEHADGIMVFTGPDWGPGSEWARRGSVNVLIENNLIVGNPDNQDQGIFLRDAGGGKALGFPHRNITIRRNKVLCPMWGGISCEGFEGLSIVDNDVLFVRGRPDAPGGQVTEARIICDERPDVLTGNTASVFVVGTEATGWKDVDDPGVKRTPEATMADVERVAAEWVAQNRGAPAPQPSPAPAPLPQPVPAPAPTPAPPAKRSKTKARRAAQLRGTLIPNATKTLEKYQAELTALEKDGY